MIHADLGYSVREESDCGPCRDRVLAGDHSVGKCCREGTE